MLRLHTDLALPGVQHALGFRGGPAVIGTTAAGDVAVLARQISHTAHRDLLVYNVFDGTAFARKVVERGPRRFSFDCCAPLAIGLIGQSTRLIYYPGDDISWFLYRPNGKIAFNPFKATGRSRSRNVRGSHRRA